MATERSAEDILEDLIKNFGENFDRSVLSSGLPSISYLNPRLKLGSVPLPEGMLGVHLKGTNTAYIRKDFPAGRDINITVGHENNHAMMEAAIGSGGAKEVSDYFDKMVGDKGQTREEISKALIKMQPYLQQRFGTRDISFHEEGYNRMDGHVLNEQIATLTAIEEAKTIDLTKDPILRKEVFNTELKRQAYNAMTSARLIKLDRNDLPVATMIGNPKRTPDEEESVLKTMYNFLTNAAGLR